MVFIYITTHYPSVLSTCTHFSHCIYILTYTLIYYYMQIFKRFDVSGQGMLTEEVRIHMSTNQPIDY